MKSMTGIIAIHNAALALLIFLLLLSSSFMRIKFCVFIGLFNYRWLIKGMKWRWARHSPFSTFRLVPYFCCGFLTATNSGHNDVYKQ